MTFTDEQVWAAVRRAGADGQLFTCASIRESLGITSTERRQLAQFRDRFREWRLAAGGAIEKVGRQAYRLTPAEPAQAPEPAAEPADDVTMQVALEELSAIAHEDAAGAVVLETDVRATVTAAEPAAERIVPKSLLAQAEQALIHTWRAGGQWFGRRFAALRNAPH